MQITKGSFILSKTNCMGNLGMPEVIILLLILGILPVAALIIAYRLGKQAGENKILRQLRSENRGKQE